MVPHRRPSARSPRLRRRPAPPRERLDQSVLAGIAGRGFTRDYWPRMLGLLEPRVLVASHFDDFFRPAGTALGMSLNVNLAALPEEIGAVSDDCAVAALTPLAPVRGG